MSDNKTFANQFGDYNTKDKKPTLREIAEAEAAEKRRAVEDKLMELELKRIERDGY